MNNRLARHSIILVLVVTLSTFWAARTAHADARCYVDASGPPLGDGTTWETAYTNLQSALTNPACTEVWVAAGVYTPGVLPTDTFTILPGTRVYGGFAGGETDVSQRRAAVHITVLSGDIGKDDANAGTTGIDVNTSDIVPNNSYHVVWMDGSATPVTSTTVLDSFVVTGGDASGAYPLGGGLSCSASGSGKACSPTLNLLIFSGNRAAGGGAIDLYAENGAVSNPTLTYSLLSGNGSTTAGGALEMSAVDDGTSNPSVFWVTFSNNWARYDGGAIESSAGYGGISNPTFVYVNFIGNTAGEDGGAVEAWTNDAESTANATYRLVTFTNNSAVDGGAMSNSAGVGGNTSPSLTNVTFHREHRLRPGWGHGQLWQHGLGRRHEQPATEKCDLQRQQCAQSGRAIQLPGYGRLQPDPDQRDLVGGQRHHCRR